MQGRRRGWSCILVLTSARTCRLSNRLKDLGQIKLRLLARPPLAPPHRLGRSFPRPNASCRSSLRLNCSSALCCRFLRLGRVHILIRFDLPSGAERLLRWRCCGCGSPAFDAPPLLAVVLTHARSPAFVALALHFLARRLHFRQDPVDSLARQSGRGRAVSRLSAGERHFAKRLRRLF